MICIPILEYELFPFWRRLSFPLYIDQRGNSLFAMGLVKLSTLVRTRIGLIEQHPSKRWVMAGKRTARVGEVLNEM